MTGAEGHSSSHYQVAFAEGGQKKGSVWFSIFSHSQHFAGSFASDAVLAQPQTHLILQVPTAILRGNVQLQGGG